MNTLSNTLSNTLKSDYVRLYPGEIAKLLESNPESLEKLLTLPATELADILDRVDPSMLRQIFQALPFGKQTELLQAAPVRLSLLILRSLESDEQQSTLDALDPMSRNELEKLLSFPVDSAGYYMERPRAQYRTTDSVAETLTKLQAANTLRARSIYAVDDNNLLVGRVDMQDMAIATQNTRLSTLISPVEGTVNLTSPRQDLLDIFEKSRVDSIPVLDLEQRLIGIIRYSSLFQAAEDQASARMQKMVGASTEERALSTAWFAVKQRLPWLHINLLTAFLAASVVGLFEDIIAQFTALAILLPVVAGQSGNAGSQALAVTMRGLALKEVNLLQWRKVLSKEFKTGIVDGIALAFTCGFGVYLWSSSTGLAIVIGVAMIISMIAAGISGALVPMILVRAGQDPATASSIILTTVTDVAGFFSFLGTATLLSFML